jgi:hypothetical protein
VSRNKCSGSSLWGVRAGSGWFVGLKIAFLDKHVRIEINTAREWADTEVGRKRGMSQPPLVVF